MTRKITISLAFMAIGALAISSAAGASGSKASADSLTGAGSTFVSKLVQAWVPKVDRDLGLKITYGPIGSGGGIAQITNRTVDFGASDAPLTPDQFAACKSCVQIPWALSATSVPYRLDSGPNRIRLNGPVLADIFLGKIKKWNDPAIRKLNKGKSIPATDITVVHRSDGSGTTYNFTDYLSRVSKEWKSRVGRGTAVDWPTGVGGRGSSGVSAALSQTNGGITYVDVAFSLANHFKFAAIQNRAGVFALPGLKGIKAAAATINRVATDNGGISIVNPAKSQPLAYPICTFTYVIVPKQTSKAADLKKFIRWTLTQGQGDGPKLLFQPIPKVVLKASLKTLNLVHS
ncbi:MAG TPA: phosphate ABC transporter substrate-binding protein PstS [Gaiellaceae bacterium]|nr:phosphate ABC transporter substrate-binding protein PstS [Gaiellaceae bacterium]